MHQKLFLNIQIDLWLLLLIKVGLKSGNSKDKTLVIGGILILLQSLKLKLTQQKKTSFLFWWVLKKIKKSKIKLVLKILSCCFNSLDRKTWSCFGSFKSPFCESISWNNSCLANCVTHWFWWTKATSCSRFSVELLKLNSEKTRRNKSLQKLKTRKWW